MSAPAADAPPSYTAAPEVVVTVNPTEAALAASFLEGRERRKLKKQYSKSKAAMGIDPDATAACVQEEDFSLCFRGRS